MHYIQEWLTRYFYLRDMRMAKVCGGERRLLKLQELGEARSSLEIEIALLAILRGRESKKKKKKRKRKKKLKNKRAPFKIGRLA